jgi:hypothetical protein
LIASAFAAVTMTMPVRSRSVRSTFANQNVRSRAIGPESVRPYCSWSIGSSRAASGFRASSASFRKNPYARPRGSFAPDFVTTFTMPAEERPYSAMPPDVTTWNSRITSSAKYVPASPAASSFAETPSTMNVLFRFRCPATEMPVPGTDDVSAKRSVLRCTVRETPGVRRARSR